MLKDAPPNAFAPFEALVSETAAALIETPLEGLDEALTQILGELVVALEMDRGTLSEIELAGDSVPAARVICSWARPPLTSLRQGEQLTQTHWATAEVWKGRPFSFDSLDELPAAAHSVRDFFRSAGVQSHVSIPTIASGTVVGALSFARATTGSRWPSRLFDRVQLLARIFAGVLERRRKEIALRRALAEVSQLRDRLEVERDYLRDEIDASLGVDEVVQVSDAFAEVLARAKRVAATGSTVLLLGETGTGKELVARQIHRLSRRRSKALITVNCAAMPPELIESELFGHEKGAFTGAGQRRMGRFKLADGGTLFLDEVGELDAASQAKVLRVLEDGELQPLGSDRTEVIDVRVIAATNRDLEGRVAEGRFRDDLYYRLSVFPLWLPPLRERPQDIEPLVSHFVAKKAVALGATVTSVPEAVLEQLRRYDWPGNVRELENVVERSLILSNGPDLQLAEPLGGAATASPLGDSLDDVERAHILEVLERSHWKINGSGNAAERLGLHPNTLRNRMKKLGIARPA